MLTPLKSEIEGSDEQSARLANMVSFSISHAIKDGMTVDRAVCIATAVAADYARGTFGDEYLDGLAEVVARRKEMPMPKISDGG